MGECHNKVLHQAKKNKEIWFRKVLPLNLRTDNYRSFSNRPELPYMWHTEELKEKDMYNALQPKFVQFAKRNT